LFVTFRKLAVYQSSATLSVFVDFLQPVNIASDAFLLACIQQPDLDGSSKRAPSPYVVRGFGEIKQKILKRDAENF